jgi:hypothetical protein
VVQGVILEFKTQHLKKRVGILSKRRGNILKKAFRAEKKGKETKRKFRSQF